MPLAGIYQHKLRRRRGDKQKRGGWLRRGGDTGPISRMKVNHTRNSRVMFHKDMLVLYFPRKEPALSTDLASIDRQSRPSTSRLWRRRQLSLCVQTQNSRPEHGALPEHELTPHDRRPRFAHHPELRYAMSRPQLPQQLLHIATVTPMHTTRSKSSSLRSQSWQTAWPT